MASITAARKSPCSSVQAAAAGADVAGEHHHVGLHVRHLGGTELEVEVADHVQAHG
ncbi:MAG TPA: hypothetical protein VMT16_15770 [Thermoanaerobaculia bacterium]|nr:hypothetical protein [Thermoanaerobaculia bacterium]